MNPWSRTLALEVRTEFQKLIRQPGFALPTLGFPLLFYTLFALTLARQGHAGGLGFPTYLLGTYATFGVLSTTLLAVGVGVALERGQGWLQLRRTTPMPLLTYFAAKGLVSAGFALLVILGLCSLAVGFGGVHLPFSAWLRFVAILTLGSLPFTALALAIGYLAGPSSAPAVVNLISMPLGFCSGLWLPIEMLPKLLQKVAVALPPYHLGQLALAPLAAGRRENPLVSLAVLALFSALCLAAARFGYQRDRGHTYG
ncbi:MAG TPA: ABC transporter permease [Thermoanaerobaculia bacterium]|jgi:ABC-2 type transport system permease protein|nr:ABC transporter permease [Thermoanaerobaculia bacterium]